MRRFIHIALKISMSLLVAWPLFASAQNKGGGGKKSTTIDFEDELVQGDIKKPELLYLMQKKQFNFKRLIKLREDFLPEMKRTAEDIKSGDSQP